MDQKFPPAKGSTHLNPDAAPGSAEDLFPYRDYGSDIFPPNRYYDRAWAADEWQNMWRKVWTLAGLASDVAEVGDWFKYDLGPESFIIVRTGTGPADIQAFYNVCHHRGNRIVHGDFGSGDSFKCLFHFWEWNINGSLKNIPDRDSFRPELVEDNPPLTEVRCELWDGFVFINMDADAEPLLDFLDPLPEHLKAYDFANMKIIKDLETEWPCNWKTGHDAFIEVYHVHAVHPEILPFFHDTKAQWDLFPNGHSRQLLVFGEISPKFPDQESLNDGLKLLLAEVGIDPETFDGAPNDARLAIQKAKRDVARKRGLDYSAYTDNQMTDDWNYGLFPNITFNAHPEGLLIQRFRPHPTDVEKMTYDLMVLTHPVDDPNYRVPAYMGVEDDVDISGKVRPARRKVPYGEPGLGPVISQDAYMMPYVQKGLKSAGYRGARYAEPEQQLRHWHKELERYMGRDK